jgi:hypothetical protein
MLPTLLAPSAHFSGGISTLLWGMRRNTHGDVPIKMGDVSFKRGMATSVMKRINTFGHTLSQKMCQKMCHGENKIEK